VSAKASANVRFGWKAVIAEVPFSCMVLKMRRTISILFNPALLHFLVILALINLGANLMTWLGLVEIDLGGVSEVVAGGFIIALVYTAFWERPTSR
jgi:hypothetical protein